MIPYSDNTTREGVIYDLEKRTADYVYVCRDYVYVCGDEIGVTRIRSQIKESQYSRRVGLEESEINELVAKTRTMLPKGIVGVHATEEDDLFY